MTIEKAEYLHWKNASYCISKISQLYGNNLLHFV